MSRRRVARKMVRREAMRLLRDHLGLGRSSEEKVLAKAVAVLRAYQAAEGDGPKLGFRAD